LLALAFLRILFKPLNLYALFTVSLLSLKQIISQAFLLLETLSLPLQTHTFKPYLIKGMIFTHCLLLLYDFAAYVFRSLGFFHFMFPLFFVPESSVFWFY